MAEILKTPIRYWEDAETLSWQGRLDLIRGSLNDSRTLGFTVTDPHFGTTFVAARNTSTHCFWDIEIVDGEQVQRSCTRSDGIMDKITCRFNPIRVNTVVSLTTIKPQKRGFLARLFG